MCGSGCILTDLRCGRGLVGNKPECDTKYSGAVRISARTIPLVVIAVIAVIVVIAVIAASCTNSGDDALRTTLPPATQEPGAFVLSDASSVAQAVLGGVVVVINLVATWKVSTRPLDSLGAPIRS